MAIPKFLMKAVCLIVMLLGFGYEVTIAERFAPREECSPAQSESLIPCKFRVLSYNVHGISPILNFSYVGVPVRDNDSRSGLMAWLLPRLQIIPVDRDRGDASALRASLKAIKEGGLVCFFLNKYWTAARPDN